MVLASTSTTEAFLAPLAEHSMRHRRLINLSPCDTLGVTVLFEDVGLLYYRAKTL